MNIRLVRTILLLPLLFMACRNVSGSNGKTLSECMDGVDNDGDGLIDCEDPDCAQWTHCQPGDSDADTGIGTGTDSDSDIDTDTDASTDTGPPVIDTEPGIAEGMVWVTIPGGTFWMGSEDLWFGEAEPVHRVTVPTFAMTRSVVTVAQYLECVLDGHCTEPLVYLDPFFGTWSTPGKENYPVGGVTFPQAEAFCHWAHGRLPSEAEWEYAARSGGKDRSWPWGEDPATCDHGRFLECNDSHTLAEVCATPRGNTEHGLCDMAGNTWEWIQDNCHLTYDCRANPDAYRCSSEAGVAPDDGSAWLTEGNTSRTLRSCSSNVSQNDFQECSTASRRSCFTFSASDPRIGIRCARDVP